MRYFLFDQITEINLSEKKITAFKCITLTDEILFDHFPENPILPGSLMIEGLAQLSGLIVEMILNSDEEKAVRRALLVQVDKMKFFKLSTPGDRLTYEVVVESVLEDGAKVRVLAHENGDKRASGYLFFALKEIPSEKITQQRRECYQIWTKKLENPPNYR